jgi:signal transduction histidine kinase
VDRFYFAAAYYHNLPQPRPNPFGWDSYLRLVIVPLANLFAIFYVWRSNKNSTNALINTSTCILYLTQASLVCTGIVHEYYSANDYTWEVIALMIFTLTMFGMPFRNSFLISLSMIVSGVVFLLIDAVEAKELAYNLTYMLSIWGAMIVGAYRKAELRRENFRAFSLLKQSASELETQAKELAQRNLELQQFAYASSHDLQEPLRTISNFVSILEKRMAGQLSDENKLYLGFVSKSTERMKHLIQAILEYSRIGRDLKLESFSSGEVLERVMEDLHFSITQSDAKIQVGQLPEITGYSTEFSVLLQNLLGNAIKFRRAGKSPTIKVTAHDAGDEHRFAVEDNGIGIEPKHANKVFALFGRLHSKEAYEGTGIGLAHCKKIVDLHGGRIWVESLPGKGSTFHFTISKQLISTENGTATELHHAN